MIVVLDNRDSFVFNLARCLQLLTARGQSPPWPLPTRSIAGNAKGCLDRRSPHPAATEFDHDTLATEVRVVPAHATSTADLERLAPRALVISPGPCTPAEAGCAVEAVRRLRGHVPILGVCLGHQAVAAALGGRVVRARRPVHGRTSAVHHDGIDLFAGIPSPFSACRYHSLVVDAASLPDDVVVTARDDEGSVMAIADERSAVYGVQFHPESILTQHGFRLLANFLGRAGLPCHAALVPALDADVERQAGAGAGSGSPPAAVDVHDLAGHEARRG